MFSSPADDIRFEWFAGYLMVDGAGGRWVREKLSDKSAVSVDDRTDIAVLWALQKLHRANHGDQSSIVIPEKITYSPCPAKA